MGWDWGCGRRARRVGLGWAGLWGCLGFRVSGFGFRVLGFGVLGFRVSGFGFRVLGFGV